MPNTRHEAVPVDAPWALAAEDVARALGVDPGAGLDASEVAESRARFGSNRLRRHRPRNALRLLADQFASLMMLLLSAAAVVAVLTGDWMDGLAIGVVILINAALGFSTELRAVRSMEALYTLSEVTARVRRERHVRDIAAGQLVVGDIVLVEGGDVVSADLRLLEASRLQLNESALTGESAPVEKRVEPVKDGTPLAERACMLYKGTAVTRGSGLGVVVGVGLDSELGRITALVETTDSGATPLEKRLDHLGRRLIYVTLVLTALVAAVGIALGRELGLMIETAIALAVATVPEGLPVVATIALARGLWRMAERNALISRLSAVETLGATGVILTDKTGTLTENRMELVRLALDSGDVHLDEGLPSPDDDPVLRHALEIGVLCSNVEEGSDGGAPAALGDPMEAALLSAAEAAGLKRAELIGAQPELREEAFDPDAKMMATFHRDGEGVRVAVKGAPEAVLDVCDRLLTADGARRLQPGEREAWRRRNERLAADGLRVLALAEKRAFAEDEAPYEDLAFVGLAAFLDPARDDVKAAMTECRRAGMRLVMVTGDQAATALHVARAVGLADSEAVEALPGERLASPENLSEKEREALLRGQVFARVSPEQKLNLIALHQAAGHVVAMTGDGVNDAPALKKADIGVAMGQRGTQVAREASDMVLKDDAFSTIVAAVRQGRVIFDNIRKFVLYLLSCNVSEVLVVALATAANAPLPLLPLQILFLNLVTDVFPALALGVGVGDPRIMERKPRPAGEAILTASHWWLVGGYGLLITAATLGAFAWALLLMGLGTRRAVTVSFVTLALAQLWHVFNMREPGSGWARNEISANGWIWGALALCVGLLFTAMYVPLLAGVLDLAAPNARMWAVILGFSLAPWLGGQLWLTIHGRRRRA